MMHGPSYLWATGSLIPQLLLRSLTPWPLIDSREVLHQ